MTDKPYTVVDKRGKEAAAEPCRVCGAPLTFTRDGKLTTSHTREYNKPTMDCINYLREKISELEKKK